MVIAFTGMVAIGLSFITFRIVVLYCNCLQLEEQLGSQPKLVLNKNVYSVNSEKRV